MYLGISTQYNPSNILTISVLLENASGSEWRDYDTNYSIPNAPNTLEEEIALTSTCP